MLRHHIVQAHSVPLQRIWIARDAPDEAAIRSHKNNLEERTIIISLASRTDPPFTPVMNEVPEPTTPVGVCTTLDDTESSVVPKSSVSPPQQALSAYTVHFLEEQFLRCANPNELQRLDIAKHLRDSGYKSFSDEDLVVRCLHLVRSVLNTTGVVQRS